MANDEGGLKPIAVDEQMIRALGQKREREKENNARSKSISDETGEFRRLFLWSCHRGLVRLVCARAESKRCRQRVKFALHLMFNEKKEETE